MGVATVSAITFGIGARVVRAHDDLTAARPPGIPRSAWRQSQQAAQEDQHGQHAREDRSIDEELGKVHGGRAGAGFARKCDYCCATIGRFAGVSVRFRQWAAVHGNGLRRDFVAWLNALKAVDDDAIAGIEAARDDAKIVRHRAELDLAIGGLVVVADDHDELLVLVGADGAFATARIGALRGCAMRTRTNCPAMRRPSRLSKEARRRTVPLVTSTWLSISCSWPFHQAPSFAAVDISTGICSTCADGVCLRRQGREGARDDALIGVEARIDRVDGDEPRQNRGIRTRSDQVADGDLSAADAARHGRANFGPFEVQLGGIKRGLGAHADWRSASS